MSSIKLSPNVSGTGSLTIAAPNTNTDRTLTLPDESGTVLTSASPVIAQAGVPAFRVWQSAGQSISNAVDNVILFQTKETDTTNAFNTSTSKFQPTVAGYYLLTAHVGYSANATGERWAKIAVGGAIKASSGVFNTGSGWVVPSVSVVAYMNGTTDYAQVFGWQNSGGNLNSLNLQGYCGFSGVFVGAA